VKPFSWGKQMHYYKFNIADYRKDTTHLTPIEHYIYRSLIDWYYLDEQPIPKETQSVIRRLSLGSDSVNLVINVLSDFFELTDNGYIHKRIDIEIEEYHGMLKSNKANGSKGGRPPKQVTEPVKTESVNFANPKEPTRNPNQEPLTINNKPIKYIPPIPAELFAEYQAIRKSKRAAPFTERMYIAICNQAVLAGITPEQAITLCCEKGWTGFNADWVKDKSVKPMKGYGFVSDAQFNDWLESAPTQERIANE
jgi:uncharacterized protein YdaU (DUF1376 family)